MQQLTLLWNIDSLKSVANYFNIEGDNMEREYKEEVYIYIEGDYIWLRLQIGNSQIFLKLNLSSFLSKNLIENSRYSA